MRATSQWFFETQYIIMITLRVTLGMINRNMCLQTIMVTCYNVFFNLRS